MNKSKYYRDTWFSDGVLKDAIRAFEQTGEGDLRYDDLTIRHDDGSNWGHDEPAEFFADYRKYQNYFWLVVYLGNNRFSVTGQSGETQVAVKAEKRAEIEEIFSVFESSKGVSSIAPETESAFEPLVFIGHGRSGQWRDLKDHLQDKHGYNVEAYETGARVGHTIRDILEEMIKKSSFAVLVLTAEDDQESGKVRARQNVIHEAGLFQGRLGFARAIMLLEEGVEEFSNVQGVQYIRFSKGNIKETYGDVVATLRREFS